MPAPMTCWLGATPADLRAGTRCDQDHFHQMPYGDRAWCPYCILDALTHFATLALVLPEAAAAARNALAHAVA